MVSKRAKSARSSTSFSSAPPTNAALQWLKRSFAGYWPIAAIDWPIGSVGLLEAGYPVVEEALAALGPDGATMAGHLQQNPFQIGCA